MTKEEALRIRDVLVQAVSKIEDNVMISEVPMFLKSLENTNKVIPAKTPIIWNGKILRARVTLWDREEYFPDRSPESWEPVMYKKGIRIIPKIITVTSPFQKGEIGWWNDKKYKCLLDTCVYNPEEYSEGWTLVD